MRSQAVRNLKLLNFGDNVASSVKDVCGIYAEKKICSDICFEDRSQNKTRKMKNSGFILRATNGGNWQRYLCDSVTLISG